VGLSLCLLLVNPVLGRWSDTKGRRPVLLAALLLQWLPAAVFWWLQRHPNMHPAWYYAANAATGSVSYLSIVFAALSDVMVLEEHRAPAYGLLLSGFFGGFAFAPSIPWVVHDDLLVGTISLSLIVAALVLAVVWLPETLPSSAVVVVEVVVREDDPQSPTVTETATEAMIPLTTNNTNDEEEVDVTATTTTTINTVAVAVDRTTPEQQQQQHRTIVDWLCHTIAQPLRAISILNRDWELRLLTVASFFSAMVFAADSTLVIYYVEETLDMHESDIATMCLFLGVTGVLVQGGLLQPLIAWLGERRLLVVSYVCGAAHNYLYGAARSKSTIYVALVLSQLTKTNYPLVSSLASQDVPAHEQGRVQSALSATNAVASAVGPLSMEYVQRRTQADWGKGFMFTYAALLYMIGAGIVSFLPVKCNQENNEYNDTIAIGGGDDDNNHETEGFDETAAAAAAAAALIVDPGTSSMMDNDDEPILLQHPNESTTAGNTDLEEPLLPRRSAGTTST